MLFSSSQPRTQIRSRPNPDTAATAALVVASCCCCCSHRIQRAVEVRRGIPPLDCGRSAAAAAAAAKTLTAGIVAVGGLPGRGVSEYEKAGDGATTSRTTAANLPVHCSACSLSRSLVAVVVVVVVLLIVVGIASRSLP